VELAQRADISYDCVPLSAPMYGAPMFWTEDIKYLYKKFPGSNHDVTLIEAKVLNILLPKEKELILKPVRKGENGLVILVPDNSWLNKIDLGEDWKPFGSLPSGCSEAVQCGILGKGKVAIITYPRWEYVSNTYDREFIYSKIIKVCQWAANKRDFSYLKVSHPGISVFSQEQLDNKLEVEVGKIINPFSNHLKTTLDTFIFRRTSKWAYNHSINTVPIGKKLLSQSISLVLKPEETIPLTISFPSIKIFPCTLSPFP